MQNLPISEYPEVVPPSVIVQAQFPGANPQTIAETVATPIEEQINGVEGMLYMASNATSDGLMTLTVTFKLGTSPDLAQQLVQNRVNQALPRPSGRGPAAGRDHDQELIGPDDRGASALAQQPLRHGISAQLRRAERQGPVGSAARDRAGPAVRLGRLFDAHLARPAQGGRAQAGRQRRGCTRFNSRTSTSPPASSVPRRWFQAWLTRSQSMRPGAWLSEDEFGDIVIRTSPDGVVTRLRDVARIELGASEYALRSLLDNKSAVAIPIFQAPGSNALQISDGVRRTMEELRKDMPEGVEYRIVYDPTQFVRASIRAVTPHAAGIGSVRRHRGDRLPADVEASIIPLLAVPVSIIGTFAVMLLMGFSINALSLFGLVLSIGIVGRRCDRRGGKRGAQHRAWPFCPGGQLQGDARGIRADRCHCADSICRVRSARIRQRT